MDLSPLDQAAFAALAAAQIGDVISTKRALKRPGTREGNSVVATIMKWTGREWPIPKALGMACIAASLAWLDAVGLVWFLAALSAATVLHNVRETM